MQLGFRQLDDLVLDLKGLLLVRKLREAQGADAGELEMYTAQIGQVREWLAEAALPADSRAAA
jgi:hypothetical protein